MKIRPTVCDVSNFVMSILLLELITERNPPPPKL